MRRIGEFFLEQPFYGCILPALHFDELQTLITQMTL
jgi:hypothetical protein